MSPPSQRVKICILSVAASGKSTFRRENPEYRGCRVVDVAEILPMPTPATKVLLYLGRVLPVMKRLAARTPSQRAKRPEHYFPMLKRYLQSRQEDTILLANRGPKPASVFEGISLGAVLIPIEDHLRNCRARRAEMVNPLGLPDHATTDVENIQRMRDNLSEYARHHGVPVFESYQEAVDALLVEGGSASGQLLEVHSRPPDRSTAI